MTKYRKKPEVIDAIKFDTSMTQMEVEKAFGLLPGSSPIQYDEIDDEFYIDTYAGEMDLIDGNYLLRDARGEFYPCQADIFEDTYEEVSEDDGEGYTIEVEYKEPIADPKGDIYGTTYTKVESAYIDESTDMLVIDHGDAGQSMTDFSNICMLETDGVKIGKMGAYGLVGW